MNKYRKRPVIIEAISASAVLTAVHSTWNGLPGWAFDAYEIGDLLIIERAVHINTLEGVMRAESTDMIIRGVKNELYPCKLDIFEMTYERVDS